VPCDLNFIVKDEGLIKVTGSHVHWKSDNMSEKVLDRDVTASHSQEVILIYGIGKGKGKGGILDIALFT